MIHIHHFLIILFNVLFLFFIIFLAFSPRNPRGFGPDLGQEQSPLIFAVEAQPEPERPHPGTHQRAHPSFWMPEGSRLGGVVRSSCRASGGRTALNGTPPCWASNADRGGLAPNRHHHIPLRVLANTGHRGETSGGSRVQE